MPGNNKTVQRPRLEEAGRLSTFDPDAAQSLVELVRPPAGYVFDAGVLTTYCLDYAGLIAVLLGLVDAPSVGVDPEDRVHGTQTPSAADVAEDVQTYVYAALELRDLVRVFVQRTGIEPATGSRASNKLQLLFDRVIQDRELGRGRLHAKVWVLRYAPRREPGVPSGIKKYWYRLVCTSRNLTSPNQWEAAVVCHGRDGAPSKMGRKVSKFLKSVIGAQRQPKPISKLLADLSNVRFDCGASCSNRLDFLWQWPGQTSLQARLPGARPRESVERKQSRGSVRPKSRVLVVSPFVRSETLLSFAQLAEEFTAVSTQYELDALPEATIDALKAKGARLLVLHSLPSASRTVAERVGLHAKILLYDSPHRRETWIGSANATPSGWGRAVGTNHNAEAMALLDPGVGLDRFRRVFVEDEFGLRPWLVEYQRQPLDDDQVKQRELEKLLEHARNAMRDVSASLKYRKESKILDFRISRIPRPVDPAITIKAAPLGLVDRADTLLTVTFSQGISHRYERVSAREVSSLVRIVISHPDRNIEFDIVGKLDPPEIIDARDQELIRGLVEEPEVLLRLLVLRSGRSAGGRRQGSKRRRTGKDHGPIPIERILESCATDPSMHLRIQSWIETFQGSARVDRLRPVWEKFRPLLLGLERRRQRAPRTPAVSTAPREGVQKRHG